MGTSVPAKRRRSTPIASDHPDMPALWEERGRMSLRASMLVLAGSSLAGWAAIYGICALSF